MTRAQAQVKLVRGFSISHSLFKPNEFVRLDQKNQLVDEKGEVLSKIDFWVKRFGSNFFNDGWCVLENGEYSYKN